MGRGMPGNKQKNSDPGLFMEKLAQRQMREAQNRRSAKSRDIIDHIRRAFAQMPDTMRPFEGVVLGEVARVMARWGRSQGPADDREIIARGIMRAHALLETIKDEIWAQLES